MDKFPQRILLRTDDDEFMVGVLVEVKDGVPIYKFHAFYHSYDIESAVKSCQVKVNY